MDKEQVIESADQAILELVNRTLDGIDATVEFSQAHIPDVVQQVLLWHGVKSAILFVFGIALFASSPLVLIRLNKGVNNGEEWTKDRYGDAGDGPLCFIALLYVGFAALMGPIIFMHNFDWLQILLAPKLYLFEYAARLAA